MLHSTLKKFGYPQSLVKTYEHWHVLLRPGQPTIGSLILICKEDVTSYSQLSTAAANEQHIVIQDIEHVLKKRFYFNKSKLKLNSERGKLGRLQENGKLDTNENYSKS